MNIMVTVDRLRPFSGFVAQARDKVVPAHICVAGQKGLYGMLANDDVECRRPEQEDAVLAPPHRFWPRSVALWVGAAHTNAASQAV